MNQIHEIIDSFTGDADSIQGLVMVMIMVGVICFVLRDTIKYKLRQRKLRKEGEYENTNEPW